jgi:hypothetical protein
MKRPCLRRSLIASLPLVALTGCAATERAEPLASDAIHTARPPMTLVMSDGGFVVGDALGMSLMGGSGVMLADVYEPFELD